MSKVYDYFVIGGGSGGISSARRAAAHGAVVGVAESARWGGTCVNVGCVPKKIMWWGSTVNEIATHEARHYGVPTSDGPLDWRHLKARRDASVLRLNGIYKSNLEKDQIDRFEGLASFKCVQDDGLIAVQVRGQCDDSSDVCVPDKEVLARHVLIAVGGTPDMPDIPGADLLSSSDQFFEWEEMPKKVAVVGAGYIAVELAGMLRGMGAEVHSFIRGKTPLRNFDSMVAEKLTDAMEKQGIIFHKEESLDKLEQDQDGTITITTKKGNVTGGFHKVLAAIGRKPLVESLNLPAVGVKTVLDEQVTVPGPLPNGPGLTSATRPYIAVDELQQTTCKNVYAIGDVCGRVELTPMAIAAGRRLADRLFAPEQALKELLGETGPVDVERLRCRVKADYDLVPSVVFSHPPIGSIGLTEKAAREKFGDDDIKVYTSVSVNLYYNAFDVEPAQKPRIHMKLVCVKSQKEKIVGLHVIGMGADEMLQGFGVAVKMGATKADFDRCVAIHPTAAEEMVTMAPWGMAPQ